MPEQAGGVSFKEIKPIGLQNVSGAFAYRRWLWFLNVARQHLMASLSVSSDLILIWSFSLILIRPLSSHPHLALVTSLISSHLISSCSAPCRLVSSSSDPSHLVSYYFILVCPRHLVEPFSTHLFPAQSFSSRLFPAQSSSMHLFPIQSFSTHARSTKSNPAAAFLMHGTRAGLQNLAKHKRTAHNTCTKSNPAAASTICWTSAGFQNLARYKSTAHNAHTEAITQQHL